MISSSNIHPRSIIFFSFRNLRNYFWNDSPATSSISIEPIIATESQELLPIENDHGTTINIKQPQYKNDLLLDVNNMRLALAKAKLVGRMKGGIPTIRSATNMPEEHKRGNRYIGRLMREDVPVIRSAHSESDKLSVIRSATNVPQHRQKAISHVSPLTFLHSRMKLV